MIFPNLPLSWQPVLADEFAQPYMQQLSAFLTQELAANKPIFPKKEQWFNALEHTPFNDVKVVILGQDPYHGAQQAHGLSFSVLSGTPWPPSLRNIVKELADDVGAGLGNSGDLSHWANQGVLLLNATLTVEEGKAGSHQQKGWELFTDAIIRAVNAQSRPVAFVLWGSYAQKKGAFIDEARHLVLRAVHPSPLSAHRGFFGSKPFSRINDWLGQQGLTPIDWALR